MTDWTTQKAAFQTTFNEIQNYYNTPTSGKSPLATDLDIINATTSTATAITGAKARIVAKQQAMSALNAEVSEAIQNYALENNMDSLLQQNTTLLRQIETKQAEYDTMLQNASVAEERNQNLRSSDMNISSHQVFLLGRPLRPASIPYLWALSILFISIAILLFYYYSPINIPPMYILIAMATDLVYNPWFWATLFGMASIVILFLVLRIVGKI